MVVMSKLKVYKTLVRSLTVTQFVTGQMPFLSPSTDKTYQYQWIRLQCLISHVYRVRKTTKYTHTFGFCLTGLFFHHYHWLVWVLHTFPDHTKNHWRWLCVCVWFCTDWFVFRQITEGKLLNNSSVWHLHLPLQMSVLHYITEKESHAAELFCQCVQ